ncbi:MAG: CDIF630_02480 family spore surface protein [Paraclostridium sp.]
MDRKSKALSGEGNKRLKKYRPTNSEQNAAWAEIDKLKPDSKVSTPSLQSVIDAKEWVDEGSRL